MLSLVCLCVSVCVSVDTRLMCHTQTGFSFKPERGFRPPFDVLMEVGAFSLSSTAPHTHSTHAYTHTHTYTQRLRSSKVPIACVDIPSGWHVEEGNSAGIGFDAPDLLGTS